MKVGQEFTQVTTNGKFWVANVCALSKRSSNFGWTLPYTMDHPAKLYENWSRTFQVILIYKQTDNHIHCWWYQWIWSTMLGHWPWLLCKSGCKAPKDLYLPDLVRWEGKEENFNTNRFCTELKTFIARNDSILFLLIFQSPLKLQEPILTLH